jgi:hypothetical protein
LRVVFFHHDRPVPQLLAVAAERKKEFGRLSFAGSGLTYKLGDPLVSSKADGTSEVLNRTAAFTVS